MNSNNPLNPAKFSDEDAEKAFKIYDDMLKNVNHNELNEIKTKLLDICRLYFLASNGQDVLDNPGASTYSMDLPRFLEEGLIKKVGFEQYEVTDKGWEKLSILNNIDARRALIDYDISSEPIPQDVRDTTNAHLRNDLNLD